MRATIVCLLAAGLAVPALAQEVRWTNGTGGTFSDGGNWQGGVRPNNTQYGRFDIGGRFTVSTTGSAAPQVRGLRFYGGETTINAANGINLVELTVGDTSGVRTVVVLDGSFGAFASGAFGTPSVTLRNAEIRGGNPLGSGSGSMNLYDHSEFSTASSINITGISARITADATSTVRFMGSSTSVDGLYSSGPLYMSGTTFSANGLGALGGLTAVNSRVSADSLGLSGNASLTNSTLTGSASGFQFAGQLLLSQGSRVASPVTVATESVLSVEAGCSVSTVRCAGATSVVRVAARSMTGAIFLGDGRLELTLDATNPPSSPTVHMGSGDSQSHWLTGTLAVAVAHANALRAGDHFAILELSPTISGPFPVVELQPLPAHRMLQVSYVHPLVYLDVIEGGEDYCWTADFNGDGDVGTDQDIEAFFACLAGNCCATCGTADFNGDGDIGTDGDIEAFFRVLAGGAC